MGLRDRSKQIAAAAGVPSAVPEKAPLKSLRERAQEILKRTTSIWGKSEPGTETSFRRFSLREKALAFLRGDLVPSAEPKESRARKGLLARAKELLGLTKTEEVAEKSEEKKNLETPPDSSPELNVLELAAAPEPGEEPLEHIEGQEATEEKTNEPVDPRLTEKVSEFFDKLASAIQNLDYTLRDRPEEPLPQKVEPGQETASRFFEDEKRAQPQVRLMGLRQVLPNFLPEEPYLEERPFLKRENVLPEPQIIFPTKLPFESRNPYDPLPLELTYRMSEIISPGSPYEFHVRALRSAEHYLQQGQFREAIDILERTASRIPDENIRSKIARNIKDIEDYLKKEEERVRRLPVLPPYPPEWFKPPEKIDQRIEQAQFAIENAGMQASTIQIVTQAPLETPGSPPTQNQVSSSPGAAVAGGVTTTSASGAFDLEAQEPNVSEAIPAVPGEGVGVLPAPVPVTQSEEAKTLPEPTMPPLADEEKSQGVLQQPAVPPLAAAGESLEDREPEVEKEKKEEKGPVQEIRGVLELKPPDEEDTPFLTLTYDFHKIPHQFALSRDHQIFEYAYYKYKPMLVKAQNYIRRKQITKALNYYRVIREQQIPAEFRRMIDRNIKDITEYLQKYLMARQ